MVARDIRECPYRSVPYQKLDLALTMRKTIVKNGQPDYYLTILLSIPQEAASEN